MRQASWIRALLVALIVVTVSWGCSSAPEGAAPAEPSPAGGRETPAPAPAPKEPGKIDAQDENWKKIAEEVAKSRTVQEQQQVLESQAHYDRALEYRNRGDFERAKESAQNALKAWPSNVEARKLLASINAILTGATAGTEQDRVKDEMIVQIQRAQLEITFLIREGDRYRAVGDYENALRQFEEAEFKIKSIPYNLKAMKDLLPKVEEYIRRTREASLEAQRVKDENQRRIAVIEAAAYEQARKREVLEKIAHFLEQAYMSFDQRKFDKCIQLCDGVLDIDPHYTVAMELREDAQKVRHREEYYDFLRAKVENWKRLTDRDDEAVIPYADTVVFPTAEEWAEISQRASKITLQRGLEGGAEDPEVLAINRQLDTIKLTLDFQNQKLEDMVAYIREFTGLNIFIEQNLGDKFDPSATKTFRVRDIVLRTAMRLMLDQFELDYAIDENRIIRITTKDKAGGKPVPELHDIRDILVRIQDFAGPKVELSTPGGAGAALAGASFTLEEPKESAVSEEQIVDLIKDNVAPGTWEGEYTIEKTPNQQLIVNHSPKVHRELQQFLGRLRSYTGTMVSVTARFMASHDDFLDDLGVDIINRPPVGGYDITGVGFTDIDERADSAPGAPGSEVGPGFVTRESARLETYDLRAQTFHTLLRFDPQSRSAIDPMSNKLFNQGGLGLQYQWIGEQALQTVLRAVHKEQKATIIQAPRVTVFNTQRSHIVVQTQRPYISDLEPQISTAAAAYDPVISVLTEGVVLDVRPIVSNDRKYVTLELRPSLAELQTIRSIDINAGSGQRQGVGQAIIQLPFIVLQRAETTVTIPDRGTLMISGFKDIIMRDMKSGVPFFENIPVLNFFFTRKGKTNERRRLMILVTPEIIDLSDYETRQY
ncbi:MAG TPA: tetratricopeptide repeat protein [Planctomycetota bacterium]|nr:tetratricopeptide repeat protein [Planctomycetota bacterium]